VYSPATQTVVRAIAETGIRPSQHSQQSVLVWNPEAPRPEVKLFNWQTAAHEALVTTTPSGLSGTSHLWPLPESDQVQQEKVDLKEANRKAADSLWRELFPEG
jgi:hypothetical protein